MQATGGTAPYTWTVLSGSLPTGLTMNPSGSISGTPTATGPSCLSSKLLMLETRSKLRPRSSRLPSTALWRSQPPQCPQATATILYRVAFTATGGVAPYSWRVSFGTLPVGLVLTSAGVLTGTPVISDAQTVTVQVTDSQNQTASGNYRLNVAPAPTLSLQLSPGRDYPRSPNTAPTPANPRHSLSDGYHRPRQPLAARKILMRPSFKTVRPSSSFPSLSPPALPQRSSVVAPSSCNRALRRRPSPPLLRQTHPSRQPRSSTPSYLFHRRSPAVNIAPLRTASLSRYKASAPHAKFKQQRFGSTATTLPAHPTQCPSPISFKPGTRVPPPPAAAFFFTTSRSS